MDKKIRRLNSNGISQFERYLDELRNHDYAPPPHDLLDDQRFSEALPWDVGIEDREFSIRYELGEYLVDRLRKCSQQEMSYDVGLWSWLALFYFDQLCPPENDGIRRPTENYTYILSRDYRHYPRHALRTTYIFVREYREKVRFMFSKGLHERGEIVEQLAARQYYISCQGVIETAQVLYDDPARRTFRRGAAGAGAGSVRRLTNLLEQLTLTHDLYQIRKEELLKILPSEFQRFLPPEYAPSA